MRVCGLYGVYNGRGLVRQVSGFIISFSALGTCRFSHMQWFFTTQDGGIEPKALGFRSAGLYPRLHRSDAIFMVNIRRIPRVEDERNFAAINLFRKITFTGAKRRDSH